MCRLSAPLASRLRQELLRRFYLEKGEAAAALPGLRQTLAQLDQLLLQPDAAPSGPGAPGGWFWGRQSGLRRRCLTELSLPQLLAPLADLPSWVDYLLLQELTVNPDSYLSSVFLWAEAPQGPLSFAAWDLDLTFGDLEGLADPVASSWRFNESYVAANSRVAAWFTALMADPVFRSMVASRWRGLRGGAWSDAAILGWIDSKAELLAEGPAARNFRRWPIRDVEPVTPYMRFAFDAATATWEGEVRRLKDFAQQRAAWLDQQFAAQL